MKCPNCGSTRLYLSSGDYDWHHIGSSSRYQCQDCHYISYTNIYGQDDMDKIIECRNKWRGRANECNERLAKYNECVLWEDDNEYN